MSFDGFPRTGLEFLTELGSNDRDWFQEHRSTYDADVAQPAKDFVVAITDVLRETVGPGIQGLPRTNGSISPINNDVRFAKDAPPYKDHLLFRFWDGPEKKTAPTLFVRLSEADTGFATGVTIASLDAWREAVAGDAGEELADELRKLGKGRDLDVAGQALKKVPAPYGPDHPRGDLLRHKMFQARWAEPTPKSVSSADFVDWCAKRLESCSRVHHWLVSNLGAG